MRAHWRRFVDWLHRDRLTAELDEELRFHLMRLEREGRTQGMSDSDAHRTARWRLGNVTAVTERTRATWGIGWLDELGQDLRYGARSLRRSPGFASAVVVTLALGLGGNTALFSVVNAVLLRPLPYAQPERLVTVWTSPAGSPADRNPTSYPDLMDWKARNAVFDAIGGYAYNRLEITGPEGTDQARAAIGTSDLFTMLGAQLLLGRLPLSSDERVPVVTISHTLWTRRYAGNRDILGRTLVLNEQPYTIIGIARAGFRFPTPDVDLWMSLQPITGSAAQPAATPWLTGRGFRAYRVVARLKPGVTLGAAEVAMNAVQHQLGIEYPDFAGTNVRLRPLREDAVGSVQRPLLLMLGAAAFVLLLACANVAHLVLARASTRQREMAVRRALGAGRGRLIRQLLTESTLLALVAGVVGVGVAAAGTRLLVSLRARDIPRLETASIDMTVLLFAAAVSVLTGLLFGLAPAVAGSRREAQAFLREESRGLTSGRAGTRFRSALTAAEVALALMLLVGAGLMIRSFGLLLATDPGFRPAGALAFHISFPSARYPAGSPQTTTVDRVLARVRALPGVVSTGASTNLPPSRMQQASGFNIEGEPASEPGRGPSAIYVPATPGFFATLGIPVRVGRDFTAADDSAASPVAIVNGELARRRFAGRDPLGHRIDMNGATRTIVGVSGDPTYGGVGAPMTEQVYVPFAQSPFPGVWCVVRTTGDPTALFRAVTDAVHAVDPLMNPSSLLTMDDVIADSLVRPRFNTWLLGTFGALALALASIGIYGVIAYGVARRTREIGVRIALGAQRSRVVSGVVGRGMAPVLIGLGAGVAGALLLSKVMTGLLYGIEPTDVVTFVAVTGLLGGVALVAACVPALRASRVDPIVALRAE